MQMQSKCTHSHSHSHSYIIQIQLKKRLCSKLHRKPNQPKENLMSTLAEALNAFQNTLKAQNSHQPNGGNGQTQSLDGELNALPQNGKSFSTTGQAEMQKAVAVRPTGEQHGVAIATGTPKTATEAEEIAIALTGELLPLQVQLWLDQNLKAEAVAASVGMPNIPKPQLTAQEYTQTQTALKSLSDIFAPAHTRGTELEQLLVKMFMAFNVYTGDEMKIKAQMLVWAEELEMFPMFAIRRAYKWAVRGEGKLPALSAFIKDVRLAMNSDVVARRRLMQQLVRSNV
jgi:hypothetical protein